MNNSGCIASLTRKRLWITEKVTLNRSFPNGINDLKRLAGNCDKESIWLYMHNNSTWYNMLSRFLGKHKGKNGIYEGGAVQYDLDFSAIKGRISHFHTHPKKILEQRVERELHDFLSSESDISGANISKLKKILLKNAYLESIFPSDGDIGTYYEMVTAAKSELDFKIVSPFFINNISLMPRRTKDVTIQEYHNTLTNLRNGFDMSYWAKTSVSDLASKYCAKLNRNKIGLSMTIGP